jgi:hypothetical protein
MKCAEQLLPPVLVHALRVRSYMRLYRMTGNPGNRGFGRYLRQRIRDMVARERTPAERAITVAYLGSYLVDHIIFAEKQACRILERRELTEEEEHRLWEKNYSSVIVQLARELPEGARLLDEIARLDNYGRLPESLHRLRGVHWRSIERALSGRIGNRPFLLNDLRFFERIDEILNGRKTPQAKARAVCFTVSLMADMVCWNERVPWNEAYQEIMIDLYPRISKHADVLDQIVRLD